MAVWVISVIADRPGNIPQAVANGFWDMTSNQKIMPGDDLIFWQLGGPGADPGPRVLGVATSVPTLIRPGDPSGNWGQPDERVYTHRFTFDVVTDEVTQGLLWGAVQVAMEKRLPQRAVVEIHQTAAIDLVLAQFTPSWSVIDRSVSVSPKQQHSLYEDRRRFAMQRLAIRQGQQAFRAELMRAYGRQCAFSRTTTEIVLEAAHIHCYRGQHSNLVSNGILLRSDLHSLFDALLIAVDSAYRIRVSPLVTETRYRDLDYRRMDLPSDPAAWPSPDGLADHWRDCKSLIAREFRALGVTPPQSGSSAAQARQV